MIVYFRRLTTIVTYRLQYSIRYKIWLRYFRLNLGLITWLYIYGFTRVVVSATYRNTTHTNNISLITYPRHGDIRYKLKLHFSDIDRLFSADEWRYHSYCNTFLYRIFYPSPMIFHLHCKLRRRGINFYWYNSK